MAAKTQKRTPRTHLTMTSTMMQGTWNSAHTVSLTATRKVQRRSVGSSTAGETKLGTAHLVERDASGNQTAPQSLEPLEEPVEESGVVCDSFCSIQEEMLHEPLPDDVSEARKNSGGVEEHYEDDLEDEDDDQPDMMSPMDEPGASTGLGDKEDAERKVSTGAEAQHHLQIKGSRSDEFPQERVDSTFPTCEDEPATDRTSSCCSSGGDDDLCKTLSCDLAHDDGSPEDEDAVDEDDLCSTQHTVECRPETSSSLLVPEPQDEKEPMSTVNPWSPHIGGHSGTTSDGLMVKEEEAVQPAPTTAIKDVPSPGPAAQTVSSEMETLGQASGMPAIPSGSRCHPASVHHQSADRNCEPMPPGLIPRPPVSKRPQRQASHALSPRVAMSISQSPRQLERSRPQSDTNQLTHTTSLELTNEYIQMQHQSRLEWRRLVQQQIERNAQATYLAEMKKLEALAEEMHRKQQERLERRRQLQEALQRIRQRKARQRQQQKAEDLEPHLLLPSLELIAKEQAFICDSRLNAPTSSSPRVTPRRRLLTQMTFVPTPPVHIPGSLGGNGSSTSMLQQPPPSSRHRMAHLQMAASADLHPPWRPQPPPPVI